jgi:5-methylcytosine-specific restriction endonuclease McrA
MTYREYLASRQWREQPVRVAELEAAGFRCRLCNAGGDGVIIEAHHRTYENLFNEQPGDLTALCRPCHRVVTDHLRRISFSHREPRHANIRAALENPSPLFDPTFKEMI